LAAPTLDSNASGDEQGDVVGDAVGPSGSRDGSAVEASVAAEDASAEISEEQREQRYANMFNPSVAGSEDRAGKSKIWNALNPQRLWDDGSGARSGDAAGPGDEEEELNGEEEAEGAMVDAQAALSTIQALDNEESYAQLSESEEEDDDDDDGEDAGAAVVHDDELMSMLEAKRKEREAEAEKRALALRNAHAVEMAAENARLDAERAEIAKEKEQERLAADAEKTKIHADAQERLESELTFAEFKFRRNSTLGKGGHSNA
jgi:hypothetical protein